MLSCWIQSLSSCTSQYVESTGSLSRHYVSMTNDRSSLPLLSPCVGRLAENVGNLLEFPGLAHFVDLEFLPSPQAHAFLLFTQTAYCLQDFLFYIGFTSLKNYLMCDAWFLAAYKEIMIFQKTTSKYDLLIQLEGGIIEKRKYPMQKLIESPVLKCCITWLCDYVICVIVSHHLWEQKIAHWHTQHAPLLVGLQSPPVLPAFLRCHKSRAQLLSDGTVL